MHGESDNFYLPKPLQAFLMALISVITSKSSQGTMVGFRGGWEVMHIFTNTLSDELRRNGTDLICLEDISHST